MMMICCVSVKMKEQICQLYLTCLCEILMMMSISDSLSPHCCYSWGDHETWSLICDQHHSGTLSLVTRDSDSGSWSC